MQKLTEALYFGYANVKAEGIFANERDVNRSTRPKFSSRERKPSHKANPKKFVTAQFEKNPRHCDPANYLPQGGRSNLAF